MTDPIEAAARAIHNARIAGGKNYWDWDTAGLEDAQPGYTASVYQDARAAIDAYHAAQPSDYAALLPRLRLNACTLGEVRRLADAIENLESKRAQDLVSLKVCTEELTKQIQRAEAAEAERDKLQVRIGEVDAEADALKARVAELRVVLSAIVDEFSDGDVISGEQIVLSAGRAGLEKGDE